jgi:ABC-type multidrug transport system fused ATPase/permease subunit
MGSGILMLVAAAVLLREMLALKAVARGAAIAENVSYVVLAVLCLAASVLLGWVLRFIPSDFSAAHARLGADLLSTMATVLFVIYFARVRRVMQRYLKHLQGEDQLLTTVMDTED